MKSLKCLTQLKTAFLLAVLSLSIAETQAQRFYSVVFEKLPQDQQLYPRNAQNEALVPVKGIVEVPDWNYVSIQVERNNAPFRYLRAPLQYQGSKGTFSMEVKIKAELAGYDFTVYVVKDTDSVQVVKRKNVVAGDFYVLSGQSNSTGFFTEPDTNRFCRTFGRITDNLNTAPYNPADTLWAFANQNLFWNGVGTMGFEIQKQLMEKSGIPNCLINAGFHWSSAWKHAERNEANPTDLNTGYGRMLYRLEKAGGTDAVKAYIFRQGESEAYNEGSDWAGNFERLRKYIKADFKGLQKIYVYQIDIIYYPSPTGAELRDYQRRLPEIYPDVTSIATVGTQQFDGLHYGREGNRQSGLELSRIMLKDLYSSKDTSDIYSPNLKKAFYKNQDKKQIVLVFDEGQQLVYPEAYKPNQNVTLEMKNFFYLDSNSGSVASGKAEENRVLLELTGAQTASRINYLPMYLTEGGPYYPFTGPYIKNSRGMRALTFYNVPLSVGLPTPELSATRSENNQIQLSWTQIPGATQYSLERKYPQSDRYEPVVTQASTTFTDTPDHAEKITYRLKALNETVESGDYSLAEVEFPLILAVEEDPGQILAVSPNPVAQNQFLVVKLARPTTGTLTFLAPGGKILLQKQLIMQSEAQIMPPAYSVGMHFVLVKSGGKEWTKKVIVR